MRGATFSVIDYKIDVIDLGTLGKFRVKRPVVNPKRLRRRMLHATAHAYQTLLSHTTVRGLENIPEEGPLLVLPNHVSNLDGPMVLANYPRQLEMVGPGDFKMVNLKDLMLRSYGMTLIKRGYADSTGLKALINHLKAGRDLLMFPTGGMWEKRHFEVKPGAAYLSQLTGARILPVALGGTYLKSKAPFPTMTVTFGEVMPAVPQTRSRKDRDVVLEAAAREIEERIYGLLEPEDRAMYDRWAREVYDMHVDVIADGMSAPLPYDGPALPDMSALAEFVAKPNLFRPMWENAGLLVDPFMEDRFYAPLELQIAVNQLRDALHGAYDRYLPYRMGDDAAAQIEESLLALQGLTEWAMRQELRVRLSPFVTDPEA